MSTIELFFDLVFVFTITQVATVVVHAASWSGVLHAALELSVIYWMYGGFAWLTNSNAPDSAPHRLILLLAMAAFYVCSIAVPRAFGGDGFEFGVAYVAVNVLHALGFEIYLGRSAARWVLRLLTFNLASAGLVLAAGFVHGHVRTGLWLAAVVVQLSTPLLTRPGESFSIDAEHFGERHGLVVLIVLGESLVSVAVASQRDGATTSLTVGALAGLAVAATMWWAYFDRDDSRGVTAMASAPAAQAARWAITGYYLAHLAMIFGILLLAAGGRLASGDLLAVPTAQAGWLMAAGAGLFAVGTAGFRAALRFDAPWSRLGIGVACLVAAPVGRTTSTTAELAVLAVIYAIGLKPLPDRSNGASRRR